MATKNIDACLSSKSIEWYTPKKLFNELNNEFSFDLDPCCMGGSKCKVKK